MEENRAVAHSDDDYDDEEEEESCEGEGDTTREGSSSNYDSTVGEAFNEVRDMSKKENHEVETMRELVTGVLVITASFISVAAFVFLSKNETNSFILAVRGI